MRGRAERRCDRAPACDPPPPVIVQGAQAAGAALVHRRPQARPGGARPHRPHRLPGGAVRLPGGAVRLPGGAVSPPRPFEAVAAALLASAILGRTVLWISSSTADEQLTCPVVLPRSWMRSRPPATRSSTGVIIHEFRRSASWSYNECVLQITACLCLSTKNSN